MEDSERALLAENDSLKATVEDLQQQNLVITAAMQAKDDERALPVPFSPTTTSRVHTHCAKSLTSA